MAPAIGQPRSYYKRFAFVVEIDGLVYAGFQSCSDLSLEVAVVEQREGGGVLPDKSPGLVTVADITLERGATDDEDLWNWMKEVANMAAGAGQIDPEYKRTMDIVQLDRDGAELRRWTVVGCWPTTFTAGAWDGTADENVIESVILACDYFKKAA